MLHGEAKSRRDCSRKARYPTEARARGSGQNRLSLNADDGKMWPYRCIRCGDWHLTSNEPWRGRVAPITKSSSGIFATT